MSIRDRHVRSDQLAGRVTIPFVFDDVGNSLTAALRGSFKPGIDFKVVDVQHFVRDITAAFSYEVKIGSTGIGALRAAAATPDGGNTGNGTITSVSADNNAKLGDWILTCTVEATDGGTFTVEDPDGILIATATVGVAFNGDINFTINDGSTDWALDDFITVTVTRGKTVPADATRAALVLDSNPNTLQGDQDAVITVELTTDGSGAAEEGVVYVTIVGWLARP